MDPNQPSENPEPLIGRYANYFEIGFNAYEFVLDFGQLYEGSGVARHTRIVTCAAYAKALSRLLSETVERFEGTHGTVSSEPVAD